MKNEIIKRILNAKDLIKLKVRFNDTDAMGVVHFKKYLEYFDDGFVAFMKSIENPIKPVIQSGIEFPVKRIEMLYENTANFGDYIIVETKISKIEDKSISFTHDIYRESDKIILAKVECERQVMKLETKELLNVKDFLTKLV